MFFQTSHGHVELPRRFSMALFQCNPPRAIFQRFQLFGKTHFSKTSGSPRFCWKNRGTFPQKNAAGVCFTNRLFFSQTQLFHRFLGCVGDFLPPRFSQKHRGTPRSWINLRTKKTHRPREGGGEAKAISFKRPILQSLWLFWPPQRFGLRV